MEHHLVVIPKEVAKDRGIKNYVHHMTCKHNHPPVKRVSDDRCVACMNAAWDKGKHLYITRRKEKFAASKDERLKIRAEKGEELRKKERDRYRANREKVAEYQKKWREKNKHAVEKSRQRRAGAAKARKLNEKRLLVKQCGKCAYCSCDIVEKNHMDHIIPLILGGTNDVSNLQLLCPTCNLRKADKLVSNELPSWLVGGC